MGCSRYHRVRVYLLTVNTSHDIFCPCYGSRLSMDPTYVETLRWGTPASPAPSLYESIPLPRPKPFHYPRIRMGYSEERNFYKVAWLGCSGWFLRLTLISLKYLPVDDSYKLGQYLNASEMVSVPFARALAFKYMEHLAFCRSRKVHYEHSFSHENTDMLMFHRWDDIHVDPLLFSDRETRSGQGTERFVCHVA